MVAAALVAPLAADASAVAADSPAGDAAPTFAKDVAPIVFHHCTSCHRPGEIAPFALQEPYTVH